MLDFVASISFSNCRRPGFQKRSVSVVCSEPGKISKIDVQLPNQGVQPLKAVPNPKTGRIMTYSYRDFKLVVTVKDKEGKTFDNTSSLQFRYTMSDESKASVGKPTIIKSLPFKDVPSISLPMKLGWL